MNLRLLLASIGLLFSITHTQAQAQIRLDENFIDWIPASLQYSDALGDASGIDFISLSASSDSDYVFFLIELDREINLQDNNDIGLFLDTDNNINTGVLTEGIGADLFYTFGDREGTYVRSNGTNVAIRHADIGMVTLPTVTSRQFEIAIRRDIVIAGERVFAGDSIRIMLQNQQNSGDIMPDISRTLIYALENASPSVSASYNLTKTDTSQLRILSYNVLRDGPWKSQQAAAFSRVLNSLHPDIIGFQEIYDHDAQETASLVNNILFNKYNQGWYQAKTGRDIICVSKYPISGSWDVAGNGAFLIDMGSHDLFLIVAHPPCCSNDQGRQDEIDAMMAFIRDAKAGTGQATMDLNTPIVILGDMNLVGLNRQRTTMLTGDIDNNNQYGADFTPDWNGQSLIDSKPFATGLPMNITWYQESSAFAPGRLDYLIYSGSNMQLENSFVLFTPGMSASELSSAGLQSRDAVESSDHLPVVGDFTISFAPPAGLALERNQLGLACYPNPTKDVSEIHYTLASSAAVTLSLLDQTGRKVQVLVDAAQAAGTQQVRFDAEQLPSGLYMLRLDAGGVVGWAKVVVE